MNFRKLLVVGLLAGVAMPLSINSVKAGDVGAPEVKMASNETWRNLRDSEDALRGEDKTGASGYDIVRPSGIVPGGRVTLENSPQLQRGNRSEVISDAPIQLAQSGDAAFRIGQLEEQNRQLTGKVEEMTFQLLQMQEQLRKMQEDNEFRFEELEKRGDAGSVSGKTDENLAAADKNQVEESSLGKSSPSESEALGLGSDGSRKSITEVIEGNANGGVNGTEGDNLGLPPINLGTLTFDKDGNLVDSNVGKPIDLSKQPAAIAEGLPEDPEQLFDLGYKYVQGGEYERSIEVFEAHVARFGDDKRNAEARFWLGESLFSLGRYEDAARVFLENHKKNPNGALAAQNLLKLGVSLAGLEQRELACATYAEVPKKYPGITNSIRKRIDVEQRAAKCKG